MYGNLAPACPLCAAAARDEAFSPWLELADPARRGAGAEAIADHLGFCARHAAALGGNRWTPGFAAVAGEALGILAAMLDDRPRYEERLVHMMFHARQGCAACTLERRRAPIEPSALAGAARRLCFAHYAAAAANSDEQQLARLAAGALESARAWRARLGDGPEEDPAHVQAALSWLAGEAYEAAMPRATASRSQCPVCGAAARALEGWLERVSTGVRLGVALGRLLPLCPSHLRLCAARVEQGAAREVARQATQTIAAALERGLAENERAVQRDLAQSASLWYRRRAASYDLGLRRRALRTPRCGACERIELACHRAQGEVLDLLATRRGCDALAREGDLCLRHFAGVYMLCPHGEPRAALAARQKTVLGRARDALRAGSRGEGWKLATGLLGVAGTP
jgi:hypothetical protein